jgi:hypothetical protein
MSGPSSIIRQTAELDLDPATPLLLCDVDEVVVHFLKGLESWLDRHDLWLDPASFALNGNIKHKGSNEPLVEEGVGEVLMNFFDQCTHELEPIEGAKESLEALSQGAEVVMLTNLPARFREARIRNLRGHGLEFPVITNSGLKGPAVAAIAGAHTAPVAFIDDHAGYLESAADHLPTANLVHFMQDERFGRHVDHKPFIHHRTDNWADAENFLSSVLTAERDVKKTAQCE